MIQRTTDLAKNLQRRIWFLGVFIAGLSALIVVGGSRRQEDNLFRIQARLALDSYLERHPEVLDGEPLPPINTPWFSVFRGEEELPVAYRDQARELAPGVYELSPHGPGPEEYVMVVREAAKGLPRLYLVYDVRELNERDELLYSGLLFFLAVGGVAALLALFLTTSATRRIFAPVTSLVETIETNSGPGGFAAAFDRTEDEQLGDSDEVRQLRSSLRASMARIDRLVEREREFSRNASHELRTPLTVIRSGAELLGREIESPAALRRVRSIERAALELERVIDMFLFLAREELPPAAEHPVDLEQVARSVVDASNHLLRGRDVDVQIRFARAVDLVVSERIVSILLSNLVRNAFASTQAGSVIIDGDEHRVQVLDTGPGVSAAAAPSNAPVKGGVGLLIVEDLCTRLGWDFSLSDRPSGGAVAELSWPDGVRFPSVGERP
ncbi:MAG: HAMP domain-containing histidine kinase [Thermoanaerobaculia bacterium]|nr:HAMP domain-containing histidine kinase [Thermoanaerobaculia bacterium]